MTTVIKGKIVAADQFVYDGTQETVSRKDHTGGTLSSLPINHFVDVVQAYGRGTSYTASTVQNCVNAISSRNRTILFRPGTWVIDDDLTIPSNITSYVPAGCVFSVSSGKTLTFSGPVIRDSDTWSSGSGTVTANYFFPQLASTSDTALGDALVGVSRSDGVADSLHNILEAYTFLRGNQTAVAASKMRIDLLRELSTFKLEDEAGIWPAKTHAYVGVSREFTSADPGEANSPSVALFAYATNNNSPADVVAIMGDANARTDNDVVFGANFIARSEAGVLAPKLVGVEIDVEPAAGVAPGPGTTALVINGFSSNCNIAVHINGYAGGGFVNGILFGADSSYGAGGAFIAADAQVNAFDWGVNFSNVTNFAGGTFFMPNGGKLAYKSTGGAALDAVVGGLGANNDIAFGNAASITRIRTSFGVPGGKTDGDVWFEVTGDSPNRKVQLWAQESGGSRLLAESPAY